MLRATHIVEITVEEIKEKVPTGPPSGPTVEIPTEVTVRLLTVLKGDVGNSPGSLVTLRVVRQRIRISRIFPTAGVWSAEFIKPGAEIVAFCGGKSADLTEILKDPNCEQILPAEHAMTDVTLALEAEAEQLSLSAFLDRAGAVADKLDGVFVEYLTARTMSRSLPRSESFNVIMDFVESPRLAEDVRESLVIEVEEKISDSEDVSPELADRYILCLFRLLREPAAAPMHDSILTEYLPTTIQKTKRSSKEVFHERDSQRKEAEDALGSYRGAVSIRGIFEWLSAH